MNPYEPRLKKIKELADIYSEILNPGASAAAVEKFLTEIKLEVPEDFITFYKACDGAVEGETVDVRGISFLSLESILYTKKMFDEMLDEKQQDKFFFYWHKDWLPFGDEGSYDTIAIDTSGKATGRKGCVLMRSKDLGEGEEMSILAPDFKSFILGWFKRVEEEQVYSFSVRTDDDKNELLDGEDSFDYDSDDSAAFINA